METINEISELNQKFLQRADTSSFWHSVFDENEYYSDKDIKNLFQQGWRIKSFSDSFSICNNYKMGRITILLEKN